MTNHHPNPRGLQLAELETMVRAASETRASGRGLPEQVYRALFRDRVPSLQDSSEIGRRKKAWLAENLDDRRLELVSRHPAPDRSVRHVFRLADGGLIESVLLWHHGQWTVCVSSQAGCALACRFCATGMLGLSRNLEAWEIVDQVLQVGREAGIRVGDVVFMGMGEPLMNVEEVHRAAQVMTQSLGLQISRRRITVSTAGVVPEIHRFID
ncbi:MAG: radical SAM protein, partial [Planctomycetes bacterium]|nr:radical SAM protein [Planctomycetota bacterium]